MGGVCVARCIGKPEVFIRVIHHFISGQGFSVELKSSLIRLDWLPLQELYSNACSGAREERAGGWGMRRGKREEGMDIFFIQQFNFCSADQYGLHL